MSADKDELNDIVADARKTPEVEALHNRVAERGSVSFERGKDGEMWSSQTVDGKTTIIVTPTAHPAPSLCHELLHAQLKLDGYRQYLTWVTMDESKIRWAILIAEALDNELQHHRMIGDFLKAGLPPEQFYHDGDVDYLKHARQGLKGLKRDEEPEKFLMPFLTVVAPGGYGTADERQKLKNMFKANASRATWEISSGVEQAFADWSSQSSLDPGETIVRILHLLGGYENTWIGTSQAFPAEGKFVGEPFTIAEVQAWQAKNAL